MSANAQELTPRISQTGQTITVTSKEDAMIGAVYVEWDRAVVPYDLITDFLTVPCGEDGFLHEFIPLEAPSHALTFSFPVDHPMGIYRIRIFTDENVPEDVQIWQPPCVRADILLISAHSDDEILFMGGVIPSYGVSEGAQVQVLYMTEFWATEPIREHEKLNGLWTEGLRNYPLCMGLRDYYVMSLAAAQNRYDEEAITDFLTDTIQKLKPQIVVTHDFEGEYGHGMHRLTAKATADALEKAAPSWDVPKAYFHLYGENTIHMELNTPLPAFGGKTALQVATDAYDKHVSQHIYDFFVSDSSTDLYNCADFGLYRTTVGTDTGNSMLEHIVLYEQQERLAREEQERLEKEKAEAQAAAEEAQRQEELKRIDEELAKYQKQAQERAQAALEELRQLEAELSQQRRRSLCITIGGILVIVLLLVVCAVRSAVNRKKH